MPSAPAISFDWKPSQGWRALRWATLVVGAACLLWSGLDLLAKCGLALLAIWFEWRSLRSEHKWKGSHWQIDSEGDWSWQRVDDTTGSAVLEQATILAPLIVLNLRDANRRVDLPIWPDQLDADTRRRLRVRLAQRNAVVTASTHL